MSIQSGATGNTIGGDAPGVQSVVTAGGLLTAVYGVAVAANGDLVVSNPDSTNPTPDIIRVNPITGVQSTISSGGLLVDPDGVAIAPNGDIYVADAVPPTSFASTPPRCTDSDLFRRESGISSEPDTCE